jgi:hypothetical protein
MPFLGAFLLKRGPYTLGSLVSDEKSEELDPEKKRPAVDGVCFHELHLPVYEDDIWPLGCCFCEGLRTSFFGKFEKVTVDGHAAARGAVAANMLFFSRRAWMVSQASCSCSSTYKKAC